MARRGGEGKYHTNQGNKSNNNTKRVMSRTRLLGA